jgi:hypothetical protein
VAVAVADAIRKALYISDYELIKPPSLFAYRITSSQLSES